MKSAFLTLAGRILVITAATIAITSCKQMPEIDTDLSDHALIPAPLEFTATHDVFTLDKRLKIAIPEGDSALLRLGEMLADDLGRLTGQPVKVIPERRWMGRGVVVLGLTEPESGFVPEEYRLQITEKQVLLEGGDHAGVFRGIQTLKQLIELDRVELIAEPGRAGAPAGQDHSTVKRLSSAEGSWLIPTGIIRDRPEYTYRGTMLDVARHFFGVEDVKRYIDLIAMYKINHLHLHLSDDQGWRIEIRSWPKLTEIGGSTEVGGGEGGFYTQEEFREIVAYAAERFITVVPEIDMPGHTNAALASYAELNCDGKAQKLYTGMRVGFSTLCTDKEITYAFVDDVVREIAGMCPGPYFHIGGDESHVTPLEDYIPFIQRVQDIVTKHGKIMTGWDEITHARLEMPAVAQFWRHEENAVRGIDQGMQIIMSPASRCYLDMKYDSTTKLGLDWAGYINLEQAYDWDPDSLTEGIGKEDILGVESPLWSETIETIDDIEFLAFPRLIAHAEIGWSADERRGFDDFKRRLGEHQVMLDRMGVDGNSGTDSEPVSFSGIYPHLAYYNNEGECGTGAVVPWAGRLWVITYGPHFPYGSSDMLYEITPGLEQIIRDESVGGTPANRMIHRESEQLFIGPYAIDKAGGVRTISYDRMPGRHTGNARHLTDPAGKIYYATMEEGFYEVDVERLEVNELYTDGNVLRKAGEMAQYGPLLPGAHGKGLYSGQGVLVYSNNGEAVPEALEQFDIPSGSLCEWDGNDWKVVRRNQFVEVTGPGGIFGNDHPERDPIWATGWDHKSLLIGVRDAQSGWSFYRLPKASHSYDGAHGWNTEWPRIRDIGEEGRPDYLMTMHGMFWRFPGTFSAGRTAGVRPRSAYLKVIGDFCRWNGRLVFGCDDSAQKEFLNKRRQKGDIAGPGQSNSNLWFTSPETVDRLGPATASGAVWLSEEVSAGEASEPFLFSGWDHRMVWIYNASGSPVTYTFETDAEGRDEWQELLTVEVEARSAREIVFTPEQRGEWIRVRTNRDAVTSVSFSFSDTDERSVEPDPLFAGLAPVECESVKGGLLYGLGDNRRTLGILASEFGKDEPVEQGYYELTADMELVGKEDPETAEFIRTSFAVPEQVVAVDKASVLVVDDSGRRWRLPKGNNAYSGLTDSGYLRICREVATERDLFNCHGTFYELPAENADGFAKIRPVASHAFRIHDYASYRGLLVMSGVEADKAVAGERIIRSDDGKAAVWVGAIDDLWAMGKPTGTGGPWKDTPVKAGEPSDPYLAGFYDRKTLILSHDAASPVAFRIEVEPVGHGPWMLYREVTVGPDEEFSYIFPEGFQARWLRFVADKDCVATAWLEYR